MLAALVALVDAVGTRLVDLVWGEGTLQGRSPSLFPLELVPHPDHSTLFWQPRWPPFFVHFRDHGRQWHQAHAEAHNGIACCPVNLRWVGLAGRMCTPEVGHLLALLDHAADVVIAVLVVVSFVLAVNGLLQLCEHSCVPT